tara:strand:- start:26377 stop:26580 length:204 start_codon:yes stop_codon:yes gene_type:complete
MSNNYYYLAPCRKPFTNIIVSNYNPEEVRAWFIFTEKEMSDMGIDDFLLVPDPNKLSNDLVVIDDGY